MSANRVSIFIPEPHVTGHHGPYLEWMAGGLAAFGCDVTVMTGTAQRDTETVHRLEASKSIRVIYGDDRRLRGIGVENDARVVVTQFRHWALMKQWYLDASAARSYDLIVIPYLDSFVYALAVLGSPFGRRTWAGIAMRPSFHYGEMNVQAPTVRGCWWKRPLFQTLLRNAHLKALMSIDPSFVEYMHRKGSNRARVVYLPQPALLACLPSKASARGALRIDSGRRYVLVYGAITERKGVLSLLDAMASKDFPANVDVILAGEIGPALRQQVDARIKDTLGSRVVILHRTISTEDEARLFAACDVVWLGYVNHYTASGVLTQAEQARRPVLACAEGLIGWQTRANALGLTIDATNIQSIVRGVRELMSTDWTGTKHAALVSGATPNSALNTLANALLPATDKELRRGVNSDVIAT